MSGVTYPVELDSDDVQRQLQRLADRSGDLHDFLLEAGEILVPSTQGRIERGVAPDGAPWAPLAPSTLARKRGPGPLRESLHLHGSFRYQVDGDALYVGTDLEYAAALHFGMPAHTIRPKAGKALFWPGARHPVKKVDHPGLPARPVVGLSAEDEVALLDVLQDYVTAPA